MCLFVYVQTHTHTVPIHTHTHTHTHTFIQTYTHIPGWTALHLAAEIGSLKLCQAVVKKGASFFDVEARTIDGETPVDVAKKSVYSNEKVVKFLEEQVK